MTGRCSARVVELRLGDGDAVVLGVSTDDQASHEAFTSKYSLNFPLLVDSDGTICDLYGVPRNGDFAARITFLIAPDGTVEKVWEKVNVVGHAADVLDAIKQR